MNRALEHRLRKKAWCLIIGSVAVCTIFPTVGMLFLIAGVIFALAIEFIS